MSTKSSKSPSVKVAVVIPTHWDYRLGGSQYQAKLLIEQLHSKHGAQVVYFTARAGARQDFRDHEVVSIGERKLLRRYGHFWDYFRLQRALAAFAPDVIYQRVACAYTGISARYAKRNSIPMIWHLANEHDVQPAPSSGRMLMRPHALVESRLAKRGVQFADVIVAQTKDQSRLLMANFGRSADRVIRNFHPAPAECGKQERPINVMWIANFKATKRPELFVDIAAHLQDATDVRFRMIGQPYASSVAQELIEEEIRRIPNLVYSGAVPQEEVGDLLDQAHLLVNTSKWEGFSNTFIQAWMHSVPVLALDVNPDGLLTGGDLGRKLDSVIDIANSIRELSSKPDMLRQMGRRSRVFALQEFSMGNAAELAELIVKTAVDRLEKCTRTISL